MATIEERLLQRNVPGRFSSWADDEAEDARERSRAASDSGSEEEEGVDGDEDKTSMAPSVVVDDDALMALHYRRGANTGPKAVLADHRAHERAAYARREQAKVRPFLKIRLKGIVMDRSALMT